MIPSDGHWEQGEAPRRGIGEQWRILAATNRILARATEKTAFLQEVCEYLAASRDCRLAWIARAEDDPGKTITPVAASGAASSFLDSISLTWREETNAGLPAARVLHSSEPVIIQNIATDPLFALHRELARRHNLKSVAAFQLTAGGKAYGALSLYSARANSFGAEEVELLSILADDVSFGIDALRAKRLGAEAERSLRTERDFSNTILQTAEALIAVLDPEGAVVRFNAACERLTGYSQRDLADRPFWEILVPPEQRESIRAIFMSLRANTFPGGIIEGDWLTRDGSIRRIAWSNARLSDEKGRTTFIVTTGLDVTEAQRTRRCLEASEARNRSILQSLPDLILVLDEQGTCVDLKLGEPSVLATSPNEVVGRHMEEFLPPKAAQVTRESIVGALSSNGVIAAEFDATLGDQLREFETRTIRYSEDKVLCIVREISERKLASRRLQQQLHRLRLLHEITRSIAGHQDLRSITEIVLSDLLTHLPVDFCCLVRRQSPEDPFLVAVEKHESTVDIATLKLQPGMTVELRGNGLTRCLEGQTLSEPDTAASTVTLLKQFADAGLRALVVTPLVMNQDAFGAIIVARCEAASFTSRDVEFLHQLSEHVALAAHQASLHQRLLAAYDEIKASQGVAMQQERLSAMGRMASGIAHDINNALGPVMAYPELLLETETGLSEAGRSSLGTIQAASEDIAKTVRRLSDFYRPRQTSSTLYPIQLNWMIDFVIEMTRPRWRDIPQQAGIVITVEKDTDPDLPPVLGDESEIREALINLVLNAVDALEPKGGRILLRTISRGESVIVEVTDNGPGMDPATRGRCLEPFFTTKGERGTGLGLSMVYGIVQRHYGDIEIESEGGNGTTFRLIFPRSPIGRTVVRDIARDSFNIPPLRILCVDDDPLMRETLMRILNRDGHYVEVADSGPAGVARFKEEADKGSSQPFDIVFTDLGMPYMDGNEVIRRIRAISADTPVVLLTGWGPRIDEGSGLSVENVRVLGKPPKLSEMRSALLEAVARRKA